MSSLGELGLPSRACVSVDLPERTAYFLIAARFRGLEGYPTPRRDAVGGGQSAVGAYV